MESVHVVQMTCNQHCWQEYSGLPWKLFFSEITLNTSTNRLLFLSLMCHQLVRLQLKHAVENLWCMCCNCVAAVDSLQCSWAHGVWSSCLTSRSQAHYVGPRLGFKSAGAQGPLLNSKRSSCCYGDCKPCTAVTFLMYG